MDDQRTAYLSIDSRQDPISQSSAFNPADFRIIIPNSTKLSGVSRICYTSVSVPRMFNNIDAYNNELVWYRRRVVDIPYPFSAPVANTFYKTVSPVWTVFRRLLVPPGVYNILDLLVIINAATGAEEVWTYDPTLRTIVITTAPSAPAIVWGPFVDGAHVPPTNSANMTYLTGGMAGMLDTLGIQREADASGHKEDRIPLDIANPNSFDATSGSNLSGIALLPLFDRFLHNYATWASSPYITPRMNAPNLAGPTVINVIISDVGDGSTVHASTGTLYDTLTTLNIGKTDYGVECEKKVKDGVSEGIQFSAPRNITQFRVKLYNSEFKQLTLPRNYPVHITLQFVFTNR